MDTKLSATSPVTDPAPTDLSDSIDVRLLVAGRLTPTAIPVLRDRVARRRSRPRGAAACGCPHPPRTDRSMNLERQPFAERHQIGAGSGPVHSLVAA